MTGKSIAMRSLKESLRSVRNTVVLLIIIILAANFIDPGRMEGERYPAAEPMTLVGAFAVRVHHPSFFRWRMLSQGGDYTAIWIRSFRPRPECTFDSFDWHLGQRGEGLAKVTINPGPAIYRPSGEFFAGPWILNVRLDQFPNTWADVLHQCRVRIFGEWYDLPWLTRSRFWN